MARTNSLTNFLNDIATAIKQKTGSETPIPASEFDTEILSIETAGTYQSKSITIDSNGTQVITPDENYDAIEQLVITVNVPVSQLQSKTVTITSNGNISVLPDTGYNGMAQVDLTVEVPAGTDTSDATATSNDIVYPKTAYINGQKIIGNLASLSEDPIKGGNQPTVTDDGSNIIVDRAFGNKIILNTNQQIRSVISYSDMANIINLTADKIKLGETILGVTGILEVIDTSDATATANDILKDKTAYVNGKKITGTVKDLKGSGISLPIQIYDDGYLPNTIDIYQRFSLGYAMINNDTSFQGQISYSSLASLLNVTADKIKKGETILGVTGTYEGNLPSINAGEYEYVKTFTMNDNYKSTDGYIPMVDVYSKDNDIILIVRNLSSTDSLHVWYEGEEDYDITIPPQSKSEYLYESDEPASNVDISYMHNVSSFDWIRPT